MVACCFGGAFVPAYVLPRNDNLIACAFFEQDFAVISVYRSTVEYNAAGAGSRRISAV